MLRADPKTVAIALCAFGLAACAGVEQRVSDAAGIGERGGLVRGDTAGGPFVLATWSRIRDNAAPLTVYIEGDGLAWLSASEVSPDPTPTDPLALRLAAGDPSPNVLYVARPCQFRPQAGSQSCDPAYWTQRAYAPEVVASVDSVIDAYAAKTSGGVRLVGYSGGAAVAVLVAVRRHDLLDLRTVAGNLSTARFAAYHRVSPYAGSLDPTDVANRLRGVPQIHFIGARDTTVPRLIAEDYAAHVGASPCLAIVAVATAGHSQGWAEAWATLSAQRPACR